MLRAPLNQTIGFDEKEITGGNDTAGDPETS